MDMKEMLRSGSGLSGVAERTDDPVFMVGLSDDSSGV